MPRPFTRRNALKSMAASGAAGLLPACSGTGEDNAALQHRRPNIIFIMLDDLGKEWLSCYGGREMETPNIDRLAAGGMRFTSAYSMPQCTPTRVTLLTGQYPWRHGWINHWDVPRWGSGCHFDWNRYTTFARILKKAGYATCAAGKWQINDFRVQPDAMRRHGFDDWCMWTGFETGNPPSAERYWNPYINTPEGSRTYEGRFGADVFLEHVERFITRNSDNPFAVYLPLCLTHVPFTATPLDPDAETDIDRHKAMVSYADHVTGRIMEFLDEQGLRDDTIVFFTTDNGTMKSMKARMADRIVTGGKATLGENGVCEPFIVNCPGRVPSGVTIDALTDFTDMLPTFADLAGADIPDGMVLDGHSIADLILGRVEDGDREWIMAMGFGFARLTDEGVRPVKPYGDRVVRDKRFKIWVEDGVVVRLHDLRDDPGEARNLIGSDDPVLVKARKKLETVVALFPREDAWPQYDPMPPQSWDSSPGNPK